MSSQEALKFTLRLKFSRSIRSKVHTLQAAAQTGDDDVRARPGTTINAGRTEGGSRQLYIDSI